MLPLLGRKGLAFFKMTDKIVVLTTCANEKEAGKLARALVDGRVAACVSVIPRMRSFYHWKGAVETADECLLLIKSSRESFEALSAALRKLHSYEVPEVLALAVVDGEPNYLNWLESSIRSGTL
jgi:periplasmic divalent cation tolerance protein